MRSETAAPLSGELPRPHLPIPHRSVYSTFVSHSAAPRVDTDLVLSTSLRSQHPGYTLTILPVLKCRLLAFAAAGHAVAAPSPESPEHSWLLSNEDGELEKLQWFARYNYTYSGTEYILYTAMWFNGGREGVQEMQYLLSPPGVSEAEIQALVSESSKFDKPPEPGPAIWVFDGYWQRSTELYAEVMKASWGDVILDDGLKRKIVQDVEGFFKSKEVYRRYEVPWKRGIIFYGPPGNGKTISIKALMHTLSQFSPPVTLLYVRTLHGFYGDERSIKNIFNLARRQAPCLLVFEDLDALITTRSRSYFLNEVDGITSNDGVCMIASTNHVEKLDPGISKRPSRFDRKYLFPLPEMKERVEYCRYWREKLSDNEEIEFPEKLCKAIADITEGFSFAYMKEAFVSSLMAIAGGTDEDGEERGTDQLNKFRLWRVIKVQIRNLREEMEDSGKCVKAVKVDNGAEGDEGTPEFAFGELLQQMRDAMVETEGSS